jgi:hypothetical protein
MSWSADSGDITADSGLVTADGAYLTSPTAAPYLGLITSEHRFQPKFAALMAVLLSAVGDTTAVINSMPGKFDLDTAVGNQLDIDGAWVGQDRVITQVLLVEFFGFADDQAALTMGELTNPTIGGVFYELGATFAQSTTLSDDDYRTIIRARIVRNQANGTLSDLEAALEYIFQVPCAVADIGDQSLAIEVSAPITQTQEALLNTLDILPRPAGVAIGSITYSPL